MTEEERREALEHRDVLLAIREILASPSGQMFFKYLFKHLEVTGLPELGLEGNILADKLGFLRAGNSIYKLVAEADARSACLLLATIEEEEYAKIYNAANIGTPIDERST